MKIINSSLIILMSLSFINSVTAETTKYTGTIHANSVKNLMPLANGDGVLLVEDVQAVDPLSVFPCRVFGKARVLSVEGDPVRVRFEVFWNPNCDESGFDSSD